MPDQLTQAAPPATGWTDAEESIIARVMGEEGCTRIEAIQCARRRQQLGPVKSSLPLSGLDALRYLRQLRDKGTDPTDCTAVELVFGRGYKVVQRSTTLEELLAAPEVDDADYIRVPVRRDQPALFCARDEADSFSLCWTDVINGRKVHREGTRLYALDQETSVLAFLTPAGCDPVVVYRKSQEPVIEYERRPVEPDHYERKQPFEPTVELTKAGLIDSGVYVRRRIAAPIQASIQAAEQSSDPAAGDAPPDDFSGQFERNYTLIESIGYDPSDLRYVPVTPPSAPYLPIAIHVGVPRPRRPSGRPRAAVQRTEAQRKADYRQRVKEREGL
jgi:hypothetical protein